MEFVKRPEILVVDDDAASRKLLQAVLAPMGVAVSEAVDGEAALEMITDSAWDAVLLDLKMPGMDGFTVLERIRQQYPVGKLPVVLVTGRDDPEAYARGLQLRANDFITKPVNQAELMARLGNILAMRWVQLELENSLNEQEQLLQAFEKRLTHTIRHDIHTPLIDTKRCLEEALEKLGGQPSAVSQELRKVLHRIEHLLGLTAGIMQDSCNSADPQYGISTGEEPSSRL